LKKIGNIASWIVLLSALIGLCGFTYERRQNALCYELEVKIEQPANSNFIEESDVRSLFRNHGIAAEGGKLIQLPVHQMEQLTRNHNAVSTAEVYITVDGKMVVEIVERTPLFRIYNTWGESFYLDKNGGLMLLSNKYTARVLLVSGAVQLPLKTVSDLEDMELHVKRLFRMRNNTAIQNAVWMNDLQIPDTLMGTEVLKSVYELSDFMVNDKFWNAQISHIHIDHEGAFILIPRVGNHIIVLGSPEHISEKMNNLKLFYQKGLPRVGWNEYSSLNLSFKNQIVCVKRQEYDAK
jgi:cell division protein FtsQ